MDKDLLNKLMAFNLPLIILPQSMYEDTEENEIMKALKEREGNKGREAPKVMPFVS